MLIDNQAFPYTSKEDLVFPVIELEGESNGIYELPAENYNTPDHTHPENKAPRPNKARRAFRHAQLAVNQLIQRRRGADIPRGEDDRLPLHVIEHLLAHLDIRGAAEEADNQVFFGVRAPARPCPSSADELYDRLAYSRAVARRESSFHSSSLARRLLGSCDPAARRPDLECCVTWAELPRLLGPVVAEMRACLAYVAAFRSLLDLKTEGCDHWLDLSQLRTCVFLLTGYWPHDVEHDAEAWAFGLPEDLVRLLYPQGGRFDHGEMAMNLDEVVIGPGREGLAELEGILCFRQRYCS